MEDGINQLFHPAAYPLPPQHQPFSDSHDVVQDQYHRMFSPPSSALTYHPHSTAPHIYGFYNRQAAPTNDHPPPGAPSSPPCNEPQSPFSQDPSPPSQTPQPEPPIDDEPLYVNAKQYYRILKRRVARARLEEVHRLSQKRKVTTLICL